MPDPRWNGWLTALRMEGSSVTENRNLEDEAASDRARVLYSASFRRLQSKAQVFSLDERSFVRNRLTHSLEVAHTGREIARLVADTLLQTQMLDHRVAAALITKVEVACLVHDIGNPPFGHFGEAAIQQWFDIDGRRCLKDACGPLEPEGVSSAVVDFLEFDGNPQGFRILTRLTSSFRDFAGLNLTWSQLVASVKYPRLPGQQGTGWKKPGVFLSEADYFARAQKHAGVAQGTRHPLVYLMEAADDISYCISDIEDGVENGLVQMSELGEMVGGPWRTFLGDTGANIGPGKGDLVLFKAKYTRTMAKRAAKHFLGQATYLEGTAKELFGPDESQLLDALKHVAGKRLFKDKTVEQVELAGLEAINGLLNHFSALLALPRAKFDLLIEAAEDRLSSKDMCKDENLGRRGPMLWRLFHMLPEKHLSAYRCQCAEEPYVERLDEEASRAVFTDATWEWNARAHLVVDYVSGMTDKFAVEVYQRLSGVKI